jgi:hypothetical protein
MDPRVIAAKILSLIIGGVLAATIAAGCEGQKEESQQKKETQQSEPQMEQSKRYDQPLEKGQGEPSQGKKPEKEEQR